MNISLLLPTRKRPHYLQRLFDSIVKTTNDLKQVEVCIYVDNDDNDTIKYLESDQSYQPFMLRSQVGERILLSTMWNKCYEMSDPTSQIFWHGNDDTVFVTKGWDTMVKEAFTQYPDRIVFIGGNDASGHHDGRFLTAGFLHKNWIETVGYFCPNLYSSDYNDTHFNDIAKHIGRWHYIKELTIEHMHPTWGKGPFDITHQERAERHKRDNVAELYDRNHSTRMSDADKLSKFIIEFGGEK